MASWKDTVMSLEELALIKLEYVQEAGETRPDVRAYVFAVRDKQAEISFSKGEQQGIDKGRKEVVKWLQETYIVPSSKQAGLIQVRNLEADLNLKLKEWEIE